MSASINRLTQLLLEKQSIGECTIRELEQMVQQYPYFSAAQLLLTKKLQADAVAGDTQQLLHDQSEKAGLYFQNPLWLQHLLDEDSNGATIEWPEDSSRYIDSSAAVAVAEQEHIALLQPQPVEFEQIRESVHSPETPTPAAATTVYTTEEVPPDIPFPEKEVEQLAEQAPPALEIHKQEDGEPNEEVEEAAIQALPDAPLPIEVLPIELPEEEERILAEPIQQAEPVVGEAQQLSPETISDGPDNTDERLDEETDLPPLPAFKIETIDPSKAALPFEPYHTIDYFASQGIKLNSDESARDKFGKQLKSFTEWLKSMKRLPDSEPIENSAGNSGKVDEMAEHSLTEREVITEAMAEVWTKQGNLPKAIEVYRKLSLLDPSKSRYFAAKIDHLSK